MDHSVHRRPMVGHGCRAQLADLAWSLSANPRTCAEGSLTAGGGSCERRLARLPSPGRFRLCQVALPPGGGAALLCVTTAGWYAAGITLVAYCTGARRLGAFALRPGPRVCPWRRGTFSPSSAGGPCSGVWGRAPPPLEPRLLSWGFQTSCFSKIRFCLQKLNHLI